MDFAFIHNTTTQLLNTQLSKYWSGFFFRSSIPIKHKKLFYWYLHQRTLM